MSLVKVQGNVSGTGVFTVAAPNSNTDRTLTLPDETGTILTNSSTTVIQKGTPAFSAYVGSAQSLAGLAFTKMALNTEEFDTASCFDSTTNYRFTPNVSGYYLIEGHVGYTNSVSAPQLVIYKNGSGFKNGSNPASGNWSNVSAIIYLNGSTDYVELYGANTSGGSSALNISASTNYFQGALVRAA